MREAGIDQAGQAPDGKAPEAMRRPESGVEAAQVMSDAMEQMAALVGHFAGAARAEACIGPVQTANGHTVIPLASVSLQAGFGLGFGGGGGGEGAAQGQGSGGAGGGGGRSVSRPVAVVDVSDEGVFIKPVADVNSLALAFLALTGLALVLRGGGACGSCPSCAVADSGARRSQTRSKPSVQSCTDGSGEGLSLGYARLIGGFVSSSHQCMLCTRLAFCRAPL